MNPRTERPSFALMMVRAQRRHAAMPLTPAQRLAGRAGPGAHAAPQRAVLGLASHAADAPCRQPVAGR